MILIYKKPVLSIVVLLLYGNSFSQGIVLSKPWNKSVFQRANDNTGYLPIEGTYTGKIDVIEAKLTPIAPTQGAAQNWTVIANPKGGSFATQLKTQGGWYKLELRGKFKNKVLTQISINQVGLGEVFYIAGQSNAEGFESPGVLPAKDERVNTIVYEENTPVNPPTFEQVTKKIPPRGASAWCWGLVGDSLANRLNVPVLFLNVAWGGSAAYQWESSALGKKTDEKYPAGMPYGNMKNILTTWLPVLGGRAILWHQGEADGAWVTWYPDQKAYYVSALKNVIEQARKDANTPNLAWMIARVSYDHSESYAKDTSWNTWAKRQPVLDAQNELINTLNDVFEGPYTDQITGEIGSEYRSDGVHFSNGAHFLHAQAWVSNINHNFFTKSQPKLPELKTNTPPKH